MRLTLKTMGGALALMLLLAACSGKEEKKPASQLAATVNGAEITVHQLNTLLKNTPLNPGDSAAVVQKKALEYLVQQQLLYDKALADKLDRDPQVMMQVENARREMLARAYLERALAGKVEPNANEIQTFYRDHPELFVERKAYQLQKLTFPLRAGLEQQLKDYAASGKSMQEISRWASEQQLPSSVEAGVVVAEEMPMAMLKKISQLEAGRVEVMALGNSAQVIGVAATQAMPLSEAQAKPRIEAYLRKLKAQQVRETFIDKLVADAKVEYKLPVVADALATTKAAVPAASGDAGKVEKGLAGLK